MKVDIEQTTLDDLPQLMEWRMEVLRDVFQEYGANADTPQLRQANEEYYRSALQNGSHIACFARIDGEPVACGALCFQRELPSPDNPSGLNAYLMNVYTRPAYRGNSISHQIVTWLIQAARAQGAGKIYLETTQRGRSVYEGAGFVDYPDIMKLPPVAEPSE